MTRRMAHVDAPLALVRDIFHDVESWPRWMPDFTSCKVLESAPHGLRAKIRQTVFGQTWQQTVDFRLSAGGVRVRARDGLLRWTAEWEFREPPESGGTTLSLDLESESSLLGLASRRLFERINHRRFEATVAAITRRTRQLAAAGAGPGEPAEGRSLLVVYETADGFEVWYAGRRYVTRKAAA